MRTSTALGPLVLTAALALAGCGAAGTAGVQQSHAASKRGAVEAPYPGSSVAGFQAVDLTWVSDQQGWALGTAPGCAGQRCATILETTDGGVQWTTVADLHDCLLEAAPVGCPAGVPQVSQIRFANADDGYAFASDGGPYSVTENGGLSWQVASGREASVIKVGFGTAIRISFSHGGCPGPCDWSIDRATVAQNSWQTLYTPPSSFNHGRVVLLRQGPEDIYAAFLGAEPAKSVAQLVVSTNGGATWQNRGDPCAADETGFVSTDFAAAPNGVLVALCAASSFQKSAVAISTDSGAEFGPLESMPPPSSGSYSEIAATSAESIFAAVPSRELVESQTGGRQWRVAIKVKQRPSAATPQTTFLGFEDPLVGRWVGPPDTLWSTTNGGLTWTARSF